MIVLLAGVLATLIIVVVILVALAGWGGPVHTVPRLGLCAMAGGLLWAAKGRFYGEPPATGDVLFLGGLALYILATYGRAVWRRADRIVEGRLPGGEAPQRRLTPHRQG